MNKEKIIDSIINILNSKNMNIKIGDDVHVGYLICTTRDEMNTQELKFSIRKEDFSDESSCRLYNIHIYNELRDLYTEKELKKFLELHEFTKNQTFCIRYEFPSDKIIKFGDININDIFSFEYVKNLNTFVSDSYFWLDVQRNAPIIEFLLDDSISILNIIVDVENFGLGG